MLFNRLYPIQFFFFSSPDLRENVTRTKFLLLFQHFVRLFLWGSVLSVRKNFLINPQIKVSRLKHRFPIGQVENVGKLGRVTPKDHYS